MTLWDDWSYSGLYPALRIRGINPTATVDTPLPGLDPNRPIGTTDGSRGIHAPVNVATVNMPRSPMPRHRRNNVPPSRTRRMNDGRIVSGRYQEMDRPPAFYHALLLQLLRSRSSLGWGCR